MGFESRSATSIDGYAATFPRRQTTSLVASRHSPQRGKQDLFSLFMVIFREISKNEKQTREIKLKYNAAKANFSCFPLWGKWIDGMKWKSRR